MAVPRNDSPAALHADHVSVHPDLLHTTHTVNHWLVEPKRLGTVVCVNASENYQFEAIE